MKIVTSEIQSERTETEIQPERTEPQIQPERTEPEIQPERTEPEIQPERTEPEIQPECGHGLMPYTASNIIDRIEMGSIAYFIVTVSEQNQKFRGTIVLEDINEEIFNFNSFAETMESTMHFRPSVGSIVAALCSSESVWKRGYITKVLESSYNVYFVDYGNSDNLVVAVKPIPLNYRHETRSVRLSFPRHIIGATIDFVHQKMILGKGQQLKIISKLADGSCLAKFIGENVPGYLVKIESWKKNLD
jgi:tudor domain-containing protein 1/4/6/7